MDRPSSSRVRSTPSNRKRRQRIEKVVEEAEEPEYDLEEGNKEEGALLNNLMKKKLFFGKK